MNPLSIIKWAKAILVPLSYEHFASLLETLDILSDFDFANRLQENIAQADRGKTVSWEEAKAPLGM